MPLRESLASLGEQVRRDGGKLFVFGSFASGAARCNSDLDLGFLFPHGSAMQKQRLTEAIEQLPTIRPIDMVDLENVDEAFRRVIDRDLVLI